MDVVLCTYENPMTGEHVIAWQKDDGKELLPAGERGFFGDLGKTDMGVFKNFTMGKNILMGRTTWDSLGRKKLKGRGTHYVLSRTKNDNAEDGVVFVNDLDSFLSEHGHDSDLVCIGGGSLYNKFLFDDKYKDFVDKISWNKLVDLTDNTFAEYMENKGWKATVLSAKEVSFSMTERDSFCFEAVGGETGGLRLICQEG